MPPPAPSPYIRARFIMVSHLGTNERLLDLLFNGHQLPGAPSEHREDGSCTQGAIQQIRQDLGGSAQRLQLLARELYHHGPNVGSILERRFHVFRERSL